MKILDIISLCSFCPSCQPVTEQNLKLGLMVRIKAGHSEDVGKIGEVEYIPSDSGFHFLSLHIVLKSNNNLHSRVHWVGNLELA